MNARQTTGRGQTSRLCSAQRAKQQGSHTLSAQRFQVLFTLFSKFFSSFVHTTCSLSVSKQYLAFAEAHQRFCTAFPNCTTLGKKKRCWSEDVWHIRDDSPLWYRLFRLLSHTTQPLPHLPGTTIPRLRIPSTSDSSLGCFLFTRRY